jgi:hypothetical protein
MVRSFSRLFLLVCLAFAAIAAPAQAGDKLAAESLFREARRLMEEKKYEQACEKFAASQAQDPAPGTLLNLGRCYEALGRTASAWLQYVEAATLAGTLGRAQQEKEARQQAQALEPKVSKLRIEPPPEPTEGLVVRRGGVAVAAGALGSEIAVDPGDYEIRAEAPGRKSWSGKVTVPPDGATASIAIPALEVGSGEAAAVPAAAPAAAPAGSADATGDIGVEPSSSSKTIGFILGGVGIVGVGVGVFLGLAASSQTSDAENDSSLCPNKVCTPDGRKEIDEAEQKALVSTIGFGVGIAALAVGTVLIVTAPSSESAQRPKRRGVAVVPAAGSHGGGLLVTGAF